MPMDGSIGSFEAKAQLSRLLKAVDGGQRFTITVRGRPVADLVPHRSPGASLTMATVKALQAFPRVQGLRDADVQAFVAEGRH